MAKKMFTETIKAWKKIVKGNQYFIQFVDNKAYLSEGHFVAAMPISFYNSEILTSVPGLPAYPGEDKSFTGREGTFRESEINVKSFIEQTERPYVTKESGMLFEDRTNNIMQRVFTWDTGSEITGAIVNEDYCKMAREYSNGVYFADKKNTPILTTNYDGDFQFLMLPIHYTIGHGAIGEYIDLLNKAQDRLTVKYPVAA